jgi:predicted naringenin-chalcone synthase
MGCHGVINALRAARGLASADPTAHLLICAVELCSLPFQFRWDPERMLGNALFADGAAALVVAPSRSKDGALFRLCDTGSCLLEDSRDAITWRIGDAGFEMTLSNRVPGLIAEQLQPWLTAWLHTRGQTIDTIRSWAVHPGGPRIVEAVDEALGFDSEMLSTSRSVLRDHGNMSSPTVLFILERLLSQNAPRPIVLLGFGPGLMAEVALLY